MTSTVSRVAAPDGTELLVRRWTPRREPWASLLLVHGIAEHSGRYEHVGDHLAGGGIDVEAYDLRGFGGSGGRRAWVDRWERQHDDLEARLRAVRAGAAGRPVVVYGHSLGGLIALGQALTERPRPDLLVLSAPAIEATIPAWKRMAAAVLGRIAPGARIPNDFDGSLLSRDPAVGERYLADPLNEHRTTARFAAAALAEQRRVRAALAGLGIPTLVVHGTDDRIVPAASTAALAAVPGVTRHEYPGLRHEVHNEPEWAVVLDDVVAWLRGRVATAAVPIRSA